MKIPDANTTTIEPFADRETFLTSLGQIRGYDVECYDIDPSDKSSLYKEIHFRIHLHKREICSQ